MKTSGRSVLGIAMVVFSGSFVAAGCATRVVEDDVDPAIASVDENVTPQGKSSATRTATPTMSCTQATGGCAPVGYRHANCAMGNLKPNTYVITCVRAVCPAVFGFDNGRGESCFTAQKVALDGTAYAFFALTPDASYSITTYASKNGVAGDALVSSTATLLSSVGENTQCGGVPSGSCL